MLCVFMQKKGKFGLTTSTVDAGSVEYLGRWQLGDLSETPLPAVLSMGDPAIEWIFQSEPMCVCANLI